MDSTLAQLWTAVYGILKHVFFFSKDYRRIDSESDSDYDLIHKKVKLYFNLSWNIKTRSQTGIEKRK